MKYLLIVFTFLSLGCSTPPSSHRTPAGDKLEIMKFEPKPWSYYAKSKPQGTIRVHTKAINMPHIMKNPPRDCKLLVAFSSSLLTAGNNSEDLFETYEKIYSKNNCESLNNGMNYNEALESRKKESEELAALREKVKQIETHYQSGESLKTIDASAYIEKLNNIEFKSKPVGTYIQVRPEILREWRQKAQEEQKE